MTSPGRRRWWPAVLAGLPAVAVFQLFAADFRDRNSVIIDETANLTCAKDVFRRGDFSTVAYFGVGPLPFLLEYGPAITMCGDGVSDVPWQTGPQDPAAARVARLTTAGVVGTRLLAVVVGWVYARTGLAWLAGWAGLVLAASPNFIAYTALAGNDACFTLFFLLALIALGRHADRPTRGRFLVAGAAVGLAVASKYSGVLLFPVAYLLGLLRPTAGGLISRALLKLPLRLLGLCVITGVVTWAATGFAWSKEPLLAGASDPPDPRPPGVLVSTLRSVRVPSPLEGFLRQGFMSTVAEKRELFVRLHGTLYPNGHRLYYVCAYLYKSTSTELLLTATVGGAAVWWAVRRRAVGGPTAAEWAVGLGVLVLFAVLSLSVKQLGLRYLMPVYPVLVGASAVVLAAVWRRRKAVAVTLAAAAAGGQLVAATAAVPWHISYVNSLFGGPERAVDLLGNQDVAWGQGWLELNQFLAAEGQPGVLNGSGRNADLELYGVRCLPWDRYDAPPCRYITIAANGLGLNPALHPRVRHFQTLKPVRVVAHCVCLYDTADPAVWAAYNAARLKPEIIQPRSSK